MTRISEQAIGEAALEALASCPGGTATIETLKKLIPRYVTLSAEDQAPSVTRPGEQMWEQQVRNLVSHRDGSQENIIAKGLAIYREDQPERLTITDAGRRHVSDRNRR